jgi:hypothetical protein
VSLAMSAGESARVRGAGRETLPTARPVSSPPDHDARPVPGADGGVMAADKSVRAWEGVYRHYGRTWEIKARERKGDPAAARAMAAASWAVAAACRRIAATSTLPWWTLAAIESAAGAFETQARDCEKTKGARAGHEVMTAWIRPPNQIRCGQWWKMAMRMSRIKEGSHDELAQLS